MTSLSLEVCWLEAKAGGGRSGTQTLHHPYQAEHGMVTSRATWEWDLSLPWFSFKYGLGLLTLAGLPQNETETSPECKPLNIIGCVSLVYWGSLSTQNSAWHRTDACYSLVDLQRNWLMREVQTSFTSSAPGAPVIKEMPICDINCPCWDSPQLQPLPFSS